MKPPRIDSLVRASRALTYHEHMRSAASVTLLTRVPRAGEVKSRLIPTLGPEGAATLQREMGAHVAAQLRILAATSAVQAHALVTGGHPREARRWLGIPVGRQAEGDLGQRQASALRDGLRLSGVSAVIGSDCPTVTAPLMRDAIRRADDQGAALISASDGGYCFLAVSAAVSDVLEALHEPIEWGSPHVLEQTVAAFTRLGVTPAVLGPCTDIDEPEDLPAWERVRTAWYAAPTSLAVVIPVLNEAARLPSLIRWLRSEGAEVIVADGGSVDGSRAIARSEGATVVKARRGRASQLNAGAAAAHADALLFLHADTRPPEGFVRLVLGELTARPGLAVGAFRFSLAARSGALRIIEAGTRLRSSVAHMPYGDQGLFCRRVVFEALGGFPALPVMEDYEFVLRAKRAGSVRVLPETAVTSDRRWREHGPWRWTALNLGTVVRYRLGTPADELAAWRAAHSKR